MKKAFSLLLAIVLTITVFAAVPAYAVGSDPYNMEAQAYMIINMDTGDVLLEKNADEIMYPASTTKMITAIIAIETMDLESTVPMVADEEVAAMTGNRLALQDGEELLVKDAINALLVASCNDVAVLFAKTIAGSVEEFAVMMNQKLLDIGATSTHFTNPHGLHDPDHYTTARDLSIIAQYCMKNPIFRSIVCKTEYTVPATNKFEARTIVSTNKLLGDTSTMMYVYNDRISTKYEGAIGIKTGSTNAAGGCLVAAATRNGTTILTVALKSSNLGRFADTHKLLNWGFDNYRTVVCVAKGDDLGRLNIKKGAVKSVKAVCGADYLTNLPSEASSSIITVKPVLDASVTAPVEAGQVVGKVEVYESGVLIGESVAVAAESVSRGGILSNFGIEDATAHKIFSTVKLIIILLIAGFIALVVVLRYINKRKKAARRAKRAAQKAEEKRRRAMWDKTYEEELRNKRDRRK